MSEDRVQIRVTGLGGQGVILCSYILGKAASIYGDYNATMTQSFGPEARGSACSAQIIVDKKRILDPYLREQNILIALSQDGYKKFAAELKPDSVLIYESELVTPKADPSGEMQMYGIPATRLAQDVVGKRLVVNIIMLGYFTAINKILSRKSVEKAVLDSVPAGTEELNMLAFKTGYEYYREVPVEIA